MSLVWEPILSLSLTTNLPRLYLTQLILSPHQGLEKWSLRLEPLNNEIDHKTGESNIADPMSRLCGKVGTSTDVLDEAGDYYMAG